MATSHTEEHNCPICFELFSKPRILPACNHVFCEKCIAKYLSDLKTDIESERKFPCPVCRVLNQCIRNDQNLLKWVQSLDMYEAAALREIPDLKGHDKIMCYPCKKVKKTNRAVKYCLNCQENYCETCHGISHAVKLLQNHSFVEVDHREDQNKNDCEITQMARYLACPVHPEKTLTWICKDENKLCCQTCAVQDHRRCNNLNELERFVSKQQNDTDSTKLKKDINDLLSHCQAIVETVKMNEQQNKSEAENIYQKISNTRAKLVNLFEVLEEDIALKVKAIIKKQSLAIEADNQDVHDIIDKLNSFISLLEKLNQIPNSETLIYILLRKLRDDLHEFERRLLQLTRDFKGHGFKLKVGKLINKLTDVNINDLKDMATVKETEYKMAIPKYTGTRLLMKCDISRVGCHSIYAPGINRLFSATRFSDVLFLQRNQLFIIDESRGCCLLVSDTFKVEASCDIMTYDSVNKVEERTTPHSATYVNNSTMAVSAPGRKRLYFMDLGGSLRIKGYLDTPHCPVALHGLNNGDIAVSWRGPVAFGILCLRSYCLEDKVYFTSDKSGRVLKTFDRMAIDEKNSHVIQPCTEDKAVYCFDFNGNPKFQYRHKELREPRGAAIDRDGNIYICDYQNGCVHIVSDTGLPVHILKDGCLQHPLAISFDEVGISFIITQKGLQQILFKKESNEFVQFSLVPKS